MRFARERRMVALRVAIAFFAVHFNRKERQEAQRTQREYQR
jgi:hypothetical protein